LKPAVWKEAKRGMVPFVFAGDYNGPGKWRYGLGFVDSGGFIGAEAPAAQERRPRTADALNALDVVDNARKRSRRRWGLRRDGEWCVTRARL
jgi:hypothetical protein